MSSIRLAGLFPFRCRPSRPLPSSATCGNLGGWQQFSAEELAKRYGSEANYVKLYAESLDRLIAQGFVLASDREEMLKIAAALYDRRPALAPAAAGQQ